MKAKHNRLLAQFSAKLPSEVISKWRMMIEAWEQDPANPNPYDEVVNGRQIVCL
jgi:hypothetical protein